MKNNEYQLHDKYFPKIENSLSFGKTCNFCRDCFNFIGDDIVWGNGLHNAKIMVVGKNSAGASEGERLWRGSRLTLIPFTNKKSGAKIRILLSRAGVNPDEVFFTNTVKCNTGRDRYRLNFNKLAPICIRHLLEEIRIVKPTIIICLGKEAFNVVFHKVEKSDVYKVKYLEHPAYVEGMERESKYVENIKEKTFTLFH